MTDQDPDTQIVQIPLAGGLQEKTQSEWLDPSAGQASIVNGQFTKQGGIAHRQGMQFSTTFSDGGPYQGIRPLSWSRHPLGAAVTNGSRTRYFSYDLSSKTQSLPTTLPSPLTIRRGLSSQTNANASPPTYSDGTFVPQSGAFVPTVIDCLSLNVRLVVNVLNGSTYVTQYDLATGEVIGLPSQVLYNASAASVTGFFVSEPSTPYVAVLLQTNGMGSVDNTAIGITITSLGDARLVCAVGQTPLDILSADITPLIGDASYGFIFFYQNPGGEWFFQYNNGNWGAVATHALEITGTASTMGAVAASFDSALATLGFLYTASAGLGVYHVRASTWTYDGLSTFTEVDAPYTVMSQAQPVFIAGLTSLAGQLFYASVYMLQTPNVSSPGGGGINAPQWLLWTMTPGAPSTFFGSDPAMTSLLGMWPVGKPFTAGSFNSVFAEWVGDQAIYQPCVSQLCTLPQNATLGSNNITSEQCTLYLVQLVPSVDSALLGTKFVSSVVSTAAPRQVDPAFSYQFLQYPTAALPVSSIWGTTRFSLAVATTASANPSVGYAADPQWIVDWYFDPTSTGLLYASSEVAGDLALAASVPMLGDGMTFFEDSYFLYPEFAVAYIPLSSSTLWPNANGTYAYAVVYTYVDATGQRSRSAPVFCLGTVNAVDTNPAPVVAFPPCQNTYRSFVSAEIYRTTNGGGTFYLNATIPGQYQSYATGSFGVASVLVVQGGAAYAAAPGVVITSADGSGSGATATATLAGGGIVSVKVTNPGVYTGSDFPVTFIGSGQNATGTAHLVELAGGTTVGVGSVTITNSGFGYTGSVLIDWSAGTGTGAAGTTVATQQYVASVQVTNPGSGYDVAPIVSFTGGGGGSGAKAIAYLNTPTSATGNNITYTDTVSDTALTTSTTLYTTGDILDAVNPPSSFMQCIHWNRKWIVDETLQTIWFTTQFVTGQAPYFNEALTIAFPDGGDITGIIGMDDKLVIFKLNGIYVIYGQGPNVLGQGSDLQLPQPVATDAGCIDWRSLVLMPAGVMFQSKTGIYLLDRSLGVTWIGKSVVDTLAEYPVITSASLVPSATHVRFTCASYNTASPPIAIVYDYLTSEWTTFSYPNIPASAFTGCYVSTEVYGTSTQMNYPAGFWALLDGVGNLWREFDLESENTTNLKPYADTDVAGNYYFVPAVTTMSWFKLQGVQGYQRARRVMLFTEMAAPAGLTVSIATNYQPSIVQTYTWPDTQVAKLPIPQVETHVAAAYNKGMAIQVTISDVGGTLFSSNASNTGQGAVFVGLAVELQRIGDRYPQVPVGGRS